MASIEITKRHTELPADLEDYVRGKVERIEKYLKEESRIEFVFDKVHDEYTIEAVVHPQRRGGQFVVRDSKADLHSAVDAVIEKLRTQLVKDKDRRKDHHRGVGLGEELASASQGDAGTAGEDDEPSYEEIVQKEVRGDRDGSK